MTKRRPSLERKNLARVVSRVCFQLLRQKGDCFFSIRANPLTMDKINDVAVFTEVFIQKMSHDLIGSKPILRMCRGGQTVDELLVPNRAFAHMPRQILRRNSGEKGAKNLPATYKFMFLYMSRQAAAPI
jgi:hypothetical protein